MSHLQLIALSEGVVLGCAGSLPARVVPLPTASAVVTTLYIWNFEISMGRRGGPRSPVVAATTKVPGFRTPRLLRPRCGLQNGGGTLHEQRHEGPTTLNPATAGGSTLWIFRPLRPMTTRIAVHANKFYSPLITNSSSPKCLQSASHFTQLYSPCYTS